MAKIRVNNRRGLFGMDFATAVQKAKPGDTLLLPEGYYTAGSIWILNLNVIGVGDPSKIVVQGQLEPKGNCSLQNLTIEAPHFSNAIKINAPGSHTTFHNVFVVAEPGQKYPPVYVANAALRMTQSRLVQQPALDSIVLDNAAIDSQDSYLGVINGASSTVDLIHCGAETMLMRDRSKVTAQGQMDFTPPEGRRSIVLSAESVGIFESLVDTAPAAEAYCDDSFLEIHELTTPNAPTYLAVTKSHATVKAPEDAVTIRDEDSDAQEPQSHNEYGPHAVVWKPEDAHSYDEVIFPQLNGEANTLLIEEGEYFLHDDPTVLSMFNFKLVGLGRAEKTILHGPIGPLENGHIAVENLTVKSAEGQEAFVVHHEATASLSNVIFETDNHANGDLVHLEQGETTIRDCVITASADHLNARGFTVRGTAKLSVQDSSLGWFTAAGRSQVDLHDCSALDVWAFEEAVLKAQSNLELLPSSTENPGLGVQTGARMSLDQVIDGSTGHVAFVAKDGTLEVNSVETEDGQPLQIKHFDDSHVTVHDGNVVYENQSQTEPQSPNPNAVAPSHDDSSPTVDSQQPKRSQQDERVSDSVHTDPLAQVMALTGLQKVKDQIAAFVKMVSFNQKRADMGLHTTHQTLHSMFLGNPGTGKTTVARLLADALYWAGAINSDRFKEVSRKDLVGTTLGVSANMTRQVLEEARGGVLFIDEAYSLYQEQNNEFAKEAVEELLSFMENHRHEITVIFAGYTSEMMDFLAMNPGLKSRIPHQFNFEDYTAEEIASIGYRSLLDEDYRVDEELYRQIVSQLYKQSADNSNGRWIRNINQRLISIMADRVSNEIAANSESHIDVQTITEQDLFDLVGGDVEAKEQKTEQLLAQLDEMTGLVPVKTWVRQLMIEAQADKQLQKVHTTFEKPTYHMVFQGNPGTGKTTVARIIAQLFHNLGILESPGVKSVNRTDLVGKYYGHTEAQTRRVIDEALGGVLFVDEAYQLSSPSGGKDFGQQAIETFVARLEDDRDKFVAIFAGYTKEMANFLASNPGLRSRIPLTIEFPDYTAEEIGQMVVSRLQESWTFDYDLLGSLAARVYQSLPVEDRSNGRWARTFGDKVISAQKQWIVDQSIPTEDALVIDDAVLLKVAHEAGLETVEDPVGDESPLH